MKGWKIGGIVSFSIVTIIYGILLYETSFNKEISLVVQLLKTYPIMLLIFVPIGIVLGLIVSALNFFFEPKKSQRKRGDIWVSTVLYIALGIIAMTVILSAGLPMINRMKERNTFIESKTLMHTISDAVSAVVSDGPGSRRILDPVIIKGGKLYFDTENNQIRWEMKTSTLLMESCPLKEVSENVCTNLKLIQKEGTLQYYLLETIVVDEYMVNVLLDYSVKGINIDLSKSEIKGPLVGDYLISVSNDGIIDGKVKVGIFIS